MNYFLFIFVPLFIFQIAMVIMYYFCNHKNTVNTTRTHLSKKRWQYIFMPFSSAEKALCFPSELLTTLVMGPFLFATGQIIMHVK